jgi:hypothetical protein
MNHRMVAEIGAQLAAALAGVLRFLVALLAIFIAHFILSQSGFMAATLPRRGHREHRLAWSG